MNIAFTRGKNKSSVLLKNGIFNRCVFKNSEFNEFFEECRRFFEKPTMEKTLRTQTSKITGKKFHLYEEEKNGKIIGVVKRKKMKCTWAFFCYVNEQLQDFLRSDDLQKKFQLNAY